MDTLEALVNASLGLVVSWTATWLVLGYTPAQSAGVTMMFFGLSFTRARIVRAVFRRIGG